jgi:hypothetical protein
MLRRFLESSVLFLHVIRWFLIAVVVGVLVGASTAYFLKVLDGSIALAGKWSWTFLLLPRVLPEHDPLDDRDTCNRHVTRFFLV